MAEDLGCGELRCLFWFALRNGWSLHKVWDWFSGHRQEQSVSLATAFDKLSNRKSVCGSEAHGGFRWIASGGPERGTLGILQFPCQNMNFMSWELLYNTRDGFPHGILCLRDYC